LTDDKNAKEKDDTPVKTLEILTAGIDLKEFDGSFNYRSMMGKLNYYLEQGTRSNISFIVHQCARSTPNRKEQHAKAIKWLE
jgi:hypothetical protein